MKFFVIRKPAFARSYCLGLLMLLLPAARSQPAFSFFCELDSTAFLQLTRDTSVIRDLQAIRAAVRVGLLDLSQTRAEGVRNLNAAGIPVVAWLLLPADSGYWFNMYNAEQAQRRYDAFKTWSAADSLRWIGVGLDLEPRMADMQEAVHDPWLGARKAWGRLYEQDQLTRARETYTELIRRMRADGFRTESYIIPPVLDDRLTGTTSFQLLMELVDIETDLEIPMCYSSVPGSSPAQILSYGAGAAAVAVGSTGGGIKVDGMDALPAMSWEMLERDLLLAQQVSREIHIFSLEGCVAQGFLPRIRSFYYLQPVDINSRELVSVQQFRSRLQLLLRFLAYPTWTVAGICLALILVIAFLVWGVIGVRRFFRLRRKGRAAEVSSAG
ncbi:MAG: hypothetical protein SF053_12625 [Bacteroidia bacterium]|nr:hypothetical protein [Bacteroidia bacterium]